MALINRSSKKQISYDNIYVIVGKSDLDDTFLRKYLQQYNLADSHPQKSYIKKPKNYLVCI